MKESCPLLTLPPEILQEILTVVRSSLGTLKAVSQSCHYLHDIATPILYSLVAIRSPESMDHFLRTAESSQYLTLLIRELQIHYHDLDEETTSSPEDIEPVFPKLVNLESLVIRSSWFDVVKASKMQLFCYPEKTLPMLRSCSLSLDLGNDWGFPVRSYGLLLQHPSLEMLSIAGAQFQLVDLSERGVPFRSTPLQQLTLLNCDVTAQEIEEMLRYPRQLRHFTMKGQQERSDLGLFGYGNRQLYVNALTSQSSSLETLDFDIQFHLWEEPISFSDFISLQPLTVSPRMLIGDNDCYWLKPATSLEWAKLLPPNLQHLTFRHDCGVYPTLQIYEAIRSGYLHLHALTCQIASNKLDDGSFYLDESELSAVTPEDIPVFRSPDDLMCEISPDGAPYLQAFRELAVEFSVIEVPRTETLPGYVSCPCTCWTYKHRLYENSSW